jgi:hypothetical protein
MTWLARLQDTMVAVAARHARADLAVGTVLWLAALAAVALIFSKKSNPHHRQEPAQR